MRHFFTHAWIGLIALSCLPVAALADEPAGIVIKTQRELGAVNWRIFGHNMEASDRRGLFNQPFDAPKIEPSGVMYGQGFWNPEANAPIPEMIKYSKDIKMSMMRYPGGCLAHRFDWKQAVGPLSERPNWKFGVAEYLELCKQLGVEPLITISDYVLPAEEMPKHAAELVEYLNAPATEKYPWAMKRKEWGHAEPYGVKWFEIGNESDHGNHKVLPRRQYSAEEYADYFLKTAAAMRAVDPSIKLGIVTVPGHNARETWSRTVISLAGKNADFVVTHFYMPSGRPKTTDGAEIPQLAQINMAAGEQAEYRLGEFRQMVRELSGRDLPLAMTEFNVGLSFVQPQGYDLASSIFLADLLGIMLKPENNVAMANYWHLHQGVWGILRTRNNKTQIYAPYLMYRLWAQHFGDTLVETKVTSPRAEFNGLGSIQPAKGAYMQPARQIGTLTIDSQSLLSVQTGSFTGDLRADGTGAFELKGLRGDQYPVFYRTKHPIAGGCDYRISFEARVVNPSSKTSQIRLGLAMQDARGYTATGSGMVVRGLQSAKDWHAFEGVFPTSADSEGFEIIGHAVAGKLSEQDAINARIEIRNLKIDLLSRETFASYAELTAYSSVSQDKKKLYIVAFNKSLDRDMPVTLELPDFSAVRARRWEINGPSAASIREITETRTAQTVATDDKKFTVVLPAHSMTALELERQ